MIVIVVKSPLKIVYISKNEKGGFTDDVFWLSSANLFQR